jgi:tRNA pseudouridine55 synthase
MATGVLVVCLGRATRVAEYLIASTKMYRGELRLGVTTDTYDAEGTVVEEREAISDRATVEAALARFRGEILQVPPMYSAIKRDGQPLHRLARRGVVVAREPRPVTVHRLELVHWAPPLLTIEVDCSAGTYIRSIAHDLGLELGCGAHLAGLVRLASGDFRLEDAIPLGGLTADRLADLVHPIDAALRGFPEIWLDEQGARGVRSGRTIRATPVEGSASLARAYGPEGEFLAILERGPDRDSWHPRKVFSPL